MSMKRPYTVLKIPYTAEEVVEDIIEEVVEITLEENVIFDPEAGKVTEKILPEAPEDFKYINDYESMKVQDLKAILKQRNLPVKGKKDDLILRLTLSDAEATEQVSLAEEEEDPAWVQAAASALKEGVSKYEKEQPVEGNRIEET
jgi:hypothetical protein